MYHNIDECLRRTYKILSVEMSPKGNTRLIIDWCETKGVLPGGGKWSQAEHLANAVMIAQQVSRCLKRPLLTAIVECQYGKLDQLLVIAGTLVAEKVCDDVVFAANMLRHLYTMGKEPRRHWIMDKYDLPSRTFHRKREKIKDWIAAHEEKARFLLQAELTQKGIIEG